jgi:hypothetical protein
MAKKKKMIDDPNTPDIDESTLDADEMSADAPVTGHDMNELGADTSQQLHVIINTAQKALPINKTINITQALLAIIAAALAAYEAHVGAPYDPENLPDIPLV